MVSNFSWAGKKAEVRPGRLIKAQELSCLKWKTIEIVVYLTIKWVLLYRNGDICVLLPLFHKLKLTMNLVSKSFAMRRGEVKKLEVKKSVLSEKIGRQDGTKHRRVKQ